MGRHPISSRNRMSWRNRVSVFRKSDVLVVSWMIEFCSASRYYDDCWLFWRDWMGDSILRAENLSKSFGEVQAVRGVSFEIRRGEIFSLLGPNGAGKTTTISMLSCLIEPAGGDAWVDGRSILTEAQ